MAIENPFAKRRHEGAATPALRPMTGYEEEALEQLAGDANVARVCNVLLARCYVPPGAAWTEALARVHAMSVLARDAALVELRAISDGDAVEHEVDCPHCTAINVARFRLRDLPIVSVDPAARGDVEVTLPSGGTATIRLPSAKDQEDLFDAELGSAAARKSFLIARVAKRIGDTRGPFDFEKVHALPSKDREAIERALDEALPELDLTMTATCVSCGRGFEHPFDITRFFFRR
jgi:hypothetical protein